MIRRVARVARVAARPRAAVAASLAAAALVAIFALLGWWPAVAVLLALGQAGLIVVVVSLNRRTARSRDIAELSQVATHTLKRLDNVAESTLAAVAAVHIEITDRLASLDQSVERSAIQQRWTTNHGLRQVEAIVQLLLRMKPSVGVPPSGGWAMDAENLLAVVDTVEAESPGLIVELGSGASSVWLGYALKRIGAGRVVSIDHDAQYAELTRDHLRRHGLDHIVEVRVAALGTLADFDHKAPWYELGVFSDLHDIDVLLVDGPPKSTGELARYPALPALADRMAEHAIVMLDDAHRPDEQNILERWRLELPEFEAVDVPGGSHLARLVRTKR
jgi:predicted O-methyltransferase YrrM